MILYSVHDNKRNSTDLMNLHDFSKFLIEVSDFTDQSSSDILFAVDEYGPQFIAERFVLTKHMINA